MNQINQHKFEQNEKPDMFGQKLLESFEEKRDWYAKN